jgi:phosphate transport system protein
MSVHLHRAIENLKGKILALSTRVEESLAKAVQSVETKNAPLALEVIEGDDAIDLDEVEVEEECLKILALHQPVATDLRFIVAVLKINSDLERIGDLAVNIASRARKLASITVEASVDIDFQGVERKVQKMVRDSLQALVTLDEELARNVCAADAEIDEINRSIHRQVTSALREHPADVDRCILLLSVSRNLERVADHATNIAEDVVYMKRGEIVRHTKVA